jgi:hypothetical protein
MISIEIRTVFIAQTYFDVYPWNKDYLLHTIILIVTLGIRTLFIAHLVLSLASPLLVFSNLVKSKNK